MCWCALGITAHGRKGFCSMLLRPCKQALPNPLHDSTQAEWTSPNSSIGPEKLSRNWFHSVNQCTTHPDSQRQRLPDVFYHRTFIENDNISMAQSLNGSDLARAPAPPPPGSPVYWLGKVTLSGCPGAALLLCSIPSLRTVLSVGPVPSQKKQPGEAGSDSEPGVERGASEGRGWGTAKGLGRSRQSEGSGI